MPGQRAIESASYVTARAAYRTNVAVVDTDVTADSIPILDTRANLQSPDVASLYGKSGQINLAALLSTAGSVTLELWLNAKLEMAAPGLGTPVVLDPVPTAAEWVLVDSTTINKSKLWVIGNLAPGQYKVLVTQLAGGVIVSLREQHAH